MREATGLLVLCIARGRSRTFRSRATAAGTADAGNGDVDVGREPANGLSDRVGVEAARHVRAQPLVLHPIPNAEHRMPLDALYGAPQRSRMHSMHAFTHAAGHGITPY